MAPDICVSLVWNLVVITLVMPKSLWILLDFLKICAPLAKRPSVNHMCHLYLDHARMNFPVFWSKPCVDSWQFSIHVWHWVHSMPVPTLLHISQSYTSVTCLPSRLLCHRISKSTSFCPYCTLSLCANCHKCVFCLSPTYQCAPFMLYEWKFPR